MKDLTALREEVDAVDRELIALFARRMEICGKIARYKQANGMEIFAPEREAQVLEVLKENAAPKMLPYTRDLFRCLMDLSKRYQQNLLAVEEFLT